MSKHSIQNDPEIQRWIENDRIEYMSKSKLELNIPSEYSGWIADLLERGLIEHQTSYGDKIPVPNEVVNFIKEFYEYEQSK